MAFEPYADNRAARRLHPDRPQSNATVAAGTLDFALRRAGNIHWQHVDVDKSARARIKHQKPACLWFTGLSGAGKSTIANLVEKRLLAMGHHTYLLDGDNVRHGLNKDLGFTDEDRVENIRRVAEVARLMVDAGLIVLVSFISPFRAERRMARELFGEGEFVEVFVDTPLEVAEQRDVKGLYAKARAGEIRTSPASGRPTNAPTRRKSCSPAKPRRKSLPTGSSGTCRTTPDARNPSGGRPPGMNKSALVAAARVCFPVLKMNGRTSSHGGDLSCLI